MVSVAAALWMAFETEANEPCITSSPLISRIWSPLLSPETTAAHNEQENRHRRKLKKAGQQIVGLVLTELEPGVAAVCSAMT